MLFTLEGIRPVTILVVILIVQCAAAMNLMQYMMMGMRVVVILTGGLVLVLVGSSFRIRIILRIKNTVAVLGCMLCILKLQQLSLFPVCFSTANDMSKLTTDDGTYHSARSIDFPVSISEDGKILQYSYTIPEVQDGSNFVLFNDCLFKYFIVYE